MTTLTRTSKKTFFYGISSLLLGLLSGGPNLLPRAVAQTSPPISPASNPSESAPAPTKKLTPWSPQRGAEIEEEAESPPLQGREAVISSPQSNEAEQGTLTHPRQEEVEPAIAEGSKPVSASSADHAQNDMSVLVKSVSLAGDKLQLHFEILPNSAVKIRGRWAVVAGFAHDEDKNSLIFKAAPAQVKLDASGNPTNLNASDGFRAKLRVGRKAVISVPRLPKSDKKAQRLYSFVTVKIFVDYENAGEKSEPKTQVFDVSEAVRSKILNH